ncbi:MAG TPA: hypothetical protein VKW76_01600 [Candidatus Binatia bacterium]|nr:hypothetical protein [Candidatus Binatia bacterium]
MPRPCCARRLLTAALLVALLASPGLALHRESQPATRVTFGADHLPPTAKQWATNGFAFVASEDYVGNGNTQQQIFVFQLLSYDCNHFTTRPHTPCPVPPGPAYVQITQGNGNARPDNPSITWSDAGPTAQNGPTASTNKEIAVFDADGSYLGGSGPAATHRQVFWKNQVTGELIRITDAPDGDSTHPQLDKSGVTVVFQSTAQLTSDTRGAGHSQIYAFHIDHALGRVQLIQLTHGAGDSITPMTDNGGHQVSFESTADLLGDGHDTGISQIFVANIDWGTNDTGATSQLLQITNGNAPSHHPYLSDGVGAGFPQSEIRYVAFDSTATNLRGTTPDVGSNIFTASTIQGNLPVIAQRTTHVPYGNCTNPTITFAMDRLAFVCDGDPMRNGTTGRRAFALNMPFALIDAPGALFQITGRGDVLPPAGLYMGRNFMTLADNTDLTGEGVCGYQLYIVDFWLDRDGQEWWHAARNPPGLGDLPQDVKPPAPVVGPDTDVIGNVTFQVDAPASTASLNTTVGVIPATLGQPGGLRGGLLQGQGGTLLLEIGARDPVTGQAPITLPVTDRTPVFPPVLLPGGALCIRAASPTTTINGIIDCNGGSPNGTLRVQKYHGGDPVVGCEQSGPTGACVEAVTGSTCVPQAPASHAGVCRGPEELVQSGTFTPGEMQLALPVLVDFETSPGFDGVFCDPNNSDDVYAFRGLPLTLYLTTGSATGAIVNADTVAGTTLSATVSGQNFNCDDLKHGTFPAPPPEVNDAHLAGALPIPDLPYVNGGVHDAVLTFDLAPVNDARGTCNATFCTRDADCGTGDPCNPVSCQNHTCVAGAPPCGTDLCNPQVCTATSATTFTCTAGTPLNCDDGNACTQDSCDPTQGCIHTDLCAAQTTDPCSPVVCTDPTTGTCGPGTPPTCDDGNPCTDDSCVAGFGCMHINNTAACDDGNGCTTGDACQNGACVGTPVQCSDGNACNGVETCVAVTTSSFLCQPGVPPNCDDGNPCTDDICDPVLGCEHTYNTTSCDDGNPCTTGDVCRNGTCSGTPISCDDGNVCNGTETCDPGTGQCVAGTPPNCDDGDPCTADACDPVQGCTHTPVADYWTCRLTQAYAMLGTVQAEVTAGPTSALGGATRQQKLLGLDQAAMTRVQTAAGLTGTRAGKKVAQAGRRLNVFLHVVQSGLGRNKVDQTLGTTLTQQVSSVVQMLRTVAQFVPPPVQAARKR